MEILDDLSRVLGTEFQRGNRQGCLEGTRVAILDGIELWARDPGGPPVFWLNGPAWAGKTSIAQSIAEMFSADGRLGASFFCSPKPEGRSNPGLIFPTLAVQLAYKYPKIRSLLAPLMQSYPGIARDSVHRQMEELIARPLRESGISTVIVIDGLDLCCGWGQCTSTVLSALGQFMSQIPKVKFFLTGRPEIPIRRGFRLLPLAEATEVFTLHDVKPSQVDSDIRLFFKREFAELADRRGGLGSWPTEEHLDLLCKRAGGLFIYALATVKFIDHKERDPREQLDRILQAPGDSEYEGGAMIKPNTTLDSLYLSTLQDIFGEVLRCKFSRLRSVLGAVVLATDPLSPSAIASLLDFSMDQVLPFLSTLHSLFIIEKGIDHPVQPFHRSFSHFITDPTRCTSREFYISPPDHHSDLLTGCLELMNRTLEKDMFRLPDGVVSSEVNDLQERTERSIDQALRYACRSWHKHLAENITRTPEIVSALHRFLEVKFLF